jgi:hypothetical protein
MKSGDVVDYADKRKLVMLANKVFYSQNRLPIDILKYVPYFTSCLFNVALE